MAWTPSHQLNFDKVKEEICKPSTLAYYDTRLKSTIQVDASGHGLGAVLLQDNRPIHFASRSLSDAEKRYANIERELLAVVFGCERFYHYIYGTSFTVESDHKPLSMIILKHISSAPLRLQRMLLKLQNVNVSITYRPGRDMIFADAFSRLLPINAPDTNTGSIRRYIHYTNVTPKTEHIIRIACETDNIDKDLRQLIAEGWPKDRRHLKTELRAYWPFRDELTIHNDLVHKGLATLIPEIAIPIILRKLHAAHVGECKMTLLARDKVFWPTIRQDLISYSNDCESCQIHERSNWKLPPNNREIPVSPWQYLAADLFQCNSTMYLLIVD